MIKTISLTFFVFVLLVPTFVFAQRFTDDSRLTCVATYPVVSQGNAGRFEVMGQIDGPFNWVVEDYMVIDAGRVFVAPMTEVGHQQVTVVWGSRRASCDVEVVRNPGYGEQYSYAPYDYVDPAYGYGGPGLNVTLSFIKLSAFPYTGPATPLASAVLATLMLTVYAALVYIYGRKGIIAAIR